MSTVELAAPRTLEGVFPLLAPDDTLLVGGGTALSLLMKAHLVAPRRLVWLGKVSALQNVSVQDGVLRIGSGVTLHSISESELVRRHCPSLAAAARQAANVRVRAVATIGGHLAHADPRQDLPPVLLAAGASVELASASSTREVRVDDLIVSFMETQITSEEVLTYVSVPVEARRRETYLRFSPRSCEDFPTVGVAAAVTTDGAGRVIHASVGVGAVGSRASLHRQLSPLHFGEGLTESLADAAAASVAEAIEPIADHRGSERYKRHVTFVLVKRALRGCVATNENGA
ncbi:MAG: FAD binding domain-containing protein [Actinomycetota bacterium]|nr:FAD binding domain-containing protein [Actinomycetota bacterium]